MPFYRRNIGVVFQDFKLLPNRTVYDNVAYALQVTGGTRKEIRAKVPDILRLTGLSTKLHNYPDQLSGGEQQRVSIARAFVNHPPLLLADEPTGNLDPETSIDIMRLLYRINRTGTTVLVATHDQAMVDKMRRRVLELSRGRIVRDEAAGLYARDETHARVRPPPARPAERPPRAVADAARLLPARVDARDAPQRRAELRRAGHRAGHDARARGVHPDRPGDQRRRRQRPRPRARRRLHEDRAPRAADDARVQRELLDVPHVAPVQFVSKQQAYAQQSKLDPAAYQLLGSNPLPDTFHVIPDNPAQRAGRPQRADAQGPAAASPGCSTRRSRASPTRRTTRRRSSR